MIDLRPLQDKIKGTLHLDKMHRTLYATDASIYREIPLGVVFPIDAEDVRVILEFASANDIPLIPRTAGTSLAGQCVGSGLVVDVSRHMTEILDFDPDGQWIEVQPGVIRDDLNRFLAPHGLFFGPNTSTANRCMLGGMLGNNSSGSTSIRYGTTRDRILEVKGFLADGKPFHVGPWSRTELERNIQEQSPEGRIADELRTLLSRPGMAELIREKYPDPAIHRRNTGYALDILMRSEIFTPGGPPFNLSQLLAGSEGTLAFTTSLKVALDPLPPPFGHLVCIHFHSLKESLEATVEVMQFEPYACELIDKVILDCTRNNREHQKNRFFLEGDPQAILVVEVRGESAADVVRQTEELESKLRLLKLGYAFPVVGGEDMNKVWDLRKAGLGLLSNVPGDAKPVACIEDTAVNVERLPEYIMEFDAMMNEFGQKAVYYAHAGAGELHLRPLIDLKTSEGREQLRKICESTAQLVKKYRGSLSGEHGDGRVRAPFIPMVMGEEIYALFQEVKDIFDPGHILNPGKIVDAPPVDSHLRYREGQKTPDLNTLLRFPDGPGLMRAVEKCNGSGDCRKPVSAGGTMCPSYMATREEKDTTRARANMLREVLSGNQTTDPFSDPELEEVLDLCLSCKGCSAECPSNVDMAAMKAVVQHKRHLAKGSSFRDAIFARFPDLNSLASPFAGIANLGLNGPFAGLTKRLLGVATQRSIPPIAGHTLRHWIRKHPEKLQHQGKLRGRIYLFVDEFTNFNEPEAGIAAIHLLTHLGIEVMVEDHAYSGRTYLSKGYLEKAKKCAEENVRVLSAKVNKEAPLIGLEPSAILGFRDEFPRLVDPDLEMQAQDVARWTFTLEEFLDDLWERDPSIGDLFKDNVQFVIHGHCHQKALSGMTFSRRLFNRKKGWEARLIPSGCCGMAGSFGMEREHYEVSQKIGELVLFPTLRETSGNTIVIASGTSCRHQIKEGVQRSALHPAQALRDLLINAS